MLSFSTSYMHNTINNLNEFLNSFRQLNTDHTPQHKNYSKQLFIIVYYTN